MPSYWSDPYYLGNMRDNPTVSRTLAGKVPGHALRPESVVDPNDRPVIPIETKRSNEYAIDKSANGEDRGNCQCVSHLEMRAELTRFPGESTSCHWQLLGFSRQIRISFWIGRSDLSRSTCEHTFCEEVIGT